MAWVRIDDNFPEHPKVAAVGGDAGWLHVCALSFCNRHLTDGHVPKAVIARLSDRKRPTALAQRLVEVGLWETSEGGWQIHDYLIYQASRAEVEAIREKTHTAKVEAGRRGGIASGEARRKQNGSRPEANIEANIEANTKQIEAPSHPIPSPRVQVRDISTPVDTPSAEGNPVDNRLLEVARNYARIALDKAPHVNNPAAYAATAQRTALEHPDIGRYCERWPTAPPDAIAAWLHGDKHSMSYYHDTADDEIAPVHPIRGEAG